MSNVSTMPNPLMQPVQYEGQTYFTAQYFHQMYRNNSDTGGKYKRAGDFMRLIRSIEAYPKYLQSGDIIEIQSKTDIPDETETQNLRLAFKSNNYAGIMLINATAQVALTHHLDDEVSKNASVNANRQAANQSAIPKISQIRVAKELLDACIGAAELLGTEPAMAKAIAVDQVREATGLDFAPLLVSNNVEEVPVIQSELAKECGVGRNKLGEILTSQGFREKDESGAWIPTEKGKPFCTVNPYKSQNSHHSGYRILWYPRVLNELDLKGMAS